MILLFHKQVINYLYENIWSLRKVTTVIVLTATTNNDIELERSVMDIVFALLTDLKF